MKLSRALSGWVAVDLLGSLSHLEITPSKFLYCQTLGTRSSHLSYLTPHQPGQQLFPSVVDPCPTTSLFQAQVTFFDSTPTGRVLNRFSSDVACVDDSLPFFLNILLANSVGLLGLLAGIASGLPWLLLLLPPLSLVYYRVQRHYRASFRELRRLSSLTLSPLYTHLADTLAGLPVLRAVGATYRCISQSESGVGGQGDAEAYRTGVRRKEVLSPWEDRGERTLRKCGCSESKLELGTYVGGGVSWRRGESNTTVGWLPFLPGFLQV